ncbi:MAG: hypothetical protein ACT4OZ_10255 [Gemmatimonadota bacterium]
MLPEGEGTLFALLILALPVAAISWTVTHEEVFREPREYCLRKSRMCRRLWERKFFYLVTCEYCFSHWVTLLVLALTNFRLLYADWRGLVVAGFALVWVANVYMGLFGRLRLDIRHERVEIEVAEAELENSDSRDGGKPEKEVKPSGKVAR